MPLIAMSIGARPSFRYVIEKFALGIADHDVAITDYLNAKFVTD